MESISDNRSWYVVYTKPRSEQKALLHLSEQGFLTYLPLFREKKRRKSRLLTDITPLFPNYLFIKLDDKHDNWTPIRSTPGVNKLVRFGDIPAKVPETFIETLRANEDDDGVQHFDQPKFAPGDRIRISDGPMAGLEAIFKTDRGSDRALIMLDIIGKLTRVELKIAHVERI